MIDPNIIANLHNYIAINPQLAIVGERLQLKRLVPMAVDRAIVEIISPVVDRSVTIACMTTQARGRTETGGKGRAFRVRTNLSTGRAGGFEALPQQPAPIPPCSRTDWPAGARALHTWHWALNRPVPMLPPSLLTAPQELVLKDHALEPDADALRKSAHLMVTGLAQSLALVTAKEPLRIAVANNLRALLSNQLDANTLEQVGVGWCWGGSAHVCGWVGCEEGKGGRGACGWMGGAAALSTGTGAQTRVLGPCQLGCQLASAANACRGARNLILSWVLPQVWLPQHIRPPCSVPDSARPSRPPARAEPQVVAMLVADNLDLCCQVIEKAAGERAQREIDERLQGAYAARVRAKAAGQPFADAALLGGRFPGALPEALRPRPGQLTPQQQRVYEDFARIPRTAAAAQQSAGQPRPAGGLGQPGEGGEAGVPGGVPPGTGLPGSGHTGSSGELDQQAAAAAAGAAGLAPQQPQQDLRSRFISWLQRMDLAIAKDPQAPLASLSDGSGEGPQQACWAARCMQAAKASAPSTHS